MTIAAEYARRASQLTAQPPDTRKMTDRVVRQTSGTSTVWHRAVYVTTFYLRDWADGPRWETRDGDRPECGQTLVGGTTTYYQHHLVGSGDDLCERCFGEASRSRRAEFFAAVGLAMGTIERNPRFSDAEVSAAMLLLHSVKFTASQVADARSCMGHMVHVADGI